MCLPVCHLVPRRPMWIKGVHTDPNTCREAGRSLIPHAEKPGGPRLLDLWRGRAPRRTLCDGMSNPWRPRATNVGCAREPDRRRCEPLCDC